MKKIVYGVVAILFAVIGVVIIVTFLRPRLFAALDGVYHIPLAIAAGLILAVLGALLAPGLVNGLEKGTEKIVTLLAAMTTADIVGCIFGLISGLIISSLIGIAVARISLIGTYLAIICVIMIGYIGLLVGYRKSQDIWQMFSREKGEKIDKDKKDHKRDKNRDGIPPKILDTSVIIDGRIADIYHTGFLEGDLVIAGFVLEELRHIADSGDNLKRNRGRGGLDILNRLRREFADSIVIMERDYPQLAEVDTKLLKLAQDLKGVVLTNDFNLNKVAQLQGVKVLNINELSNAVKPIVLPGEEMVVHIIKEGKEIGQGVAYLDDGTMIVVENGKRYMGRRIQSVVTSILQTAAGRMVFVRPKYGKDGEVPDMRDD
ncbi:MAG: hypothetical protein FWG43_02025 [Clostridiales bacterium]|nr:hypothetical protein [Clostridiales bacterium]